jgi:hypothetical protein
VRNDYQRAFREVEQLDSLTDGWDSYEGRAITKEAMTAATRALIALRDHAPSIVPTAQGGVQLEWHVARVDMEIEFGPDGEQVFDKPEKKADG